MTNKIYSKKMGITPKKPKDHAGEAMKKVLLKTQVLSMLPKISKQPEKKNIQDIFTNKISLSKFNKPTNIKPTNIKPTLIQQKKFITCAALGKYGRLGNQLFQYATLFSIATQTGHAIKLPMITRNISDKNQSKLFMYFKNIQYEPLLDSMKIDRVINEQMFLYNPNLVQEVNNYNNVNIHGYFQSYKYFDHMRDKILHIFQFKDSIKYNCVEIMKKYRETNKIIVSCHVRRGDLVNYTGYGPPTSIEFINNAISKLESILNLEYSLLVFSDDITWTKNNLVLNNSTLRKNIMYSENMNEGEDLCLQSMCDHNIVTNSTYSWWGAYLNTNNKKIIITKACESNDNSWFYDFIVSDQQRADLLPPNFIPIKDTLTTQLKDIIYSTIYDQQKELNIYTLKLIKELKIENNEYLRESYDFGIVIPTYNRYQYVKYLFESLKNANYDNLNVIFILLDDGSTQTELLENLIKFTLNKIPIVKLLCNRLNLVDQTDKKLNTIMPGSAFPYTLRFGTDILFRINCKLVCHLDSDSIVSKYWIHRLIQYHQNIDVNKNKLISGFEAQTLDSVVAIYDNYKQKKVVGGLGIIFDRDLYNLRIRKWLIDHRFDWNICLEMERNKENIYVTVPSVIQHTGIVSTMLRGEDLVEKFRKGNLDINTDLDKLINNSIIINDIRKEINFNDMMDFLFYLNKITKLNEFAQFPYAQNFVYDNTEISFNSKTAKILENKKILLNINTYVDKIFIINMHSRKDRWQKVDNHLKNNNITNYERFNAIVPIYRKVIKDEHILKFIKSGGVEKVLLLENYPISSYNKAAFDYIGSMNPQQQVSIIKGLVGCKDSHINVLQIAKKRNYKRILILEDDISFIKNFNKYLDYAIKDIQEKNINYDLLYLSANHAKPYDQVTDNLVKVNFGLSTPGYLIAEHMFDTVINHAMVSGMEIDTYYAKEIQPLGNCYAICPNIINQNQDFSSIENRLVNYSTNTNMLTIRKFDIVIVAHSKDKETLKLLIESIKRFISHYRNIYLISKENFLAEEDMKVNIIHISENSYIFTKDGISDLLTSKLCVSHQIGWYYQQLLKLYAFKTILDLTEHFLIIDADTVFLDFYRVFNDDNIPYFTTGTENHKPYFEHIDKLIPGLNRMTKYSGIVHHMMFNKTILNDLFNYVENLHNKKFYQAFIDCIDFSKGMCLASEYEIYFNFVIKFHRDKYELREVKWANCSNNDLHKHKIEGNLFVALHDHFKNDHTKYVAE
jgi:GR25 family glycosyltransferase involved in LPS biosynthesis